MMTTAQAKTIRMNLKLNLTFSQETAKTLAINHIQLTIQENPANPRPDLPTHFASLFEKNLGL